MMSCAGISIGLARVFSVSRHFGTIFTVEGSFLIFQVLSKAWKLDWHCLRRGVYLGCEYLC
jgi:hypothetical protein